MRRASGRRAGVWPVSAAALRVGGSVTDEIDDRGGGSQNTDNWNEDLPKELRALSHDYLIARQNSGVGPTRIRMCEVKQILLPIAPESYLIHSPIWQCSSRLRNGHRYTRLAWKFIHLWLAHLATDNDM